MTSHGITYQSAANSRLQLLSSLSIIALIASTSSFWKNLNRLVCTKVGFSFLPPYHALTTSNPDTISSVRSSTHTQGLANFLHARVISANGSAIGTSIYVLGISSRCNNRTIWEKVKYSGGWYSILLSYFPWYVDFASNWNKPINKLAIIGHRVATLS